MGGSHRVDLAWKLADKKLNMITVAQADEILEAQTKHFGTESLPYNKSLGRVLAENIVADRDLPPFDRSTVDGIAICFSRHEGGIKEFSVAGIQSAGDPPINSDDATSCIEIMTGAVVGSSFDTVVRYEDVTIENGKATLNTEIKKGQNIHLKGKDKQKATCWSKVDT